MDLSVLLATLPQVVRSVSMAVGDVEDLDANGSGSPVEIVEEFSVEVELGGVGQCSDVVIGADAEGVEDVVMVADAADGGIACALSLTTGSQVAVDEHDDESSYVGGAAGGLRIRKGAEAAQGLLVAEDEVLCVEWYDEGEKVDEVEEEEEAIQQRGPSHRRILDSHSSYPCNRWSDRRDIRRDNNGHMPIVVIRAEIHENILLKSDNRGHLPTVVRNKFSRYFSFVEY